MCFCLVCRSQEEGDGGFDCQWKRERKKTWRSREVRAAAAAEQRSFLTLIAATATAISGALAKLSWNSLTTASEPAAPSSLNADWDSENLTPRAVAILESSEARGEAFR